MTVKTHNKEFRIMKFSVLGFGILALPEVIVILLQLGIYLLAETIIELGYLSSSQLELLSELLSTLYFICFQIAFLGFPVLALGIYSFSYSRTDQIGKEGKNLSIYILIFFVCLLIINVFGYLLLLIMGDFQMISALADIDAAFRAGRKNYKDMTRIWACFVVIIFIFLLIIILKFSAWFNNVAKKHSNEETFALVLVGGIYFIAALFVFLAISILFPLIRTTPVDRTPLHMARRMNVDLTDISSIMGIIPLQDVIEAQVISLFLLLLGFCYQFIVSIKLFLKLTNMSLTEVKN
ncbi:MAG: hypothetical protein ACXADY_00135 [Candidatus Hodarchaeales archaeon]